MSCVKKMNTSTKTGKIETDKKRLTQKQTCTQTRIQSLQLQTELITEEW